MERFLRLFPSYRRRLLELEAQQAEAAESVQRFQGQIHELRSEVDRLREERDEAQKQERQVYQMMLNVDNQVKYGFTPFPAAPHLPSAMENKGNGGPVEADYVNASSMLHEVRAQKRNDAKAWLERNG
jgi:hypothetical protein